MLEFWKILGAKRNKSSSNAIITLKTSLLYTKLWENAFIFLFRQILLVGFTEGVNVGNGTVGRALGNTDGTLVEGAKAKKEKTKIW